MPLLNHPSQHAAMREWKLHAQQFLTNPKPKAIVVVSAHYETNGVVKVGSAAQPKMVYDYGGFPASTYTVKYPAPGNPELAARMVKLLTDAGIKAVEDPQRGFDHGVFIPLMFMAPEAEIPVVPLSVLVSQGASEHIAIGRALAPLRSEGVFFLGSGSSSHHFGSDGENQGNTFNNFLTQVVTNDEYTAEQRTKTLDKYLTFPGASEAQRQGAAEHLTPLFTVLGTAAGSMKGAEISNIIMGDWNQRHYLFEN